MNKKEIEVSTKTCFEFKNVYDKNLEDLADMNITPEQKHKFMNFFPFLEKFILLARQKKFDLMIGGSYPLLATRNLNFIPGDIDFYTLNINTSKIYLMDEIINSIAEESSIIILPLSVTWRILVNKKYYDIQLGIVNYSTWTKVFFSYHSGIVCSGYLILQDKFVSYQKRFENDLDFNTLTNVSQPDSLYEIWKKYKNRGFNNSIVLTYRNITLDMYIESSGMYIEENLGHIIETTMRFAFGNENTIMFAGIYVDNIHNFIDEKFYYLDSIYLCGRLCTIMKINLGLSQYRKYMVQFKVNNRYGSYLVDNYVLIKPCPICKKKKTKIFMNNNDNYCHKLISDKGPFRYGYLCPGNDSIIWDDERDENIKFEFYNHKKVKSARNI